MDAAADTEFGDFMSARWPGLVRLAYGLTGDRQAAEDLAQTALAKVFASWPRIRRRGAADAYATRTLVNTFLADRRLRRNGAQLLRGRLQSVRRLRPAARLYGRRRSRQGFVQERRLASLRRVQEPGRLRELLRHGREQRPGALIQWLSASSAATTGSVPLYQRG